MNQSRKKTFIFILKKNGCISDQIKYWIIIGFNGVLKYHN